MDNINDLLWEYIEQVNDLYESPEWYNILTANCTTSIYRKRRNKLTWDWRILFNGKLDEMLYDWKRLYQGMPFEELKKASWINGKANSANEATFSHDIRKGLPGFETKEFETTNGPSSIP